MNRTETPGDTDTLAALTLDLPPWIEKGRAFLLVFTVLALLCASAFLPWRQTISIPLIVEVRQAPPGSNTSDAAIIEAVGQIGPQTSATVAAGAQVRISLQNFPPTRYGYFQGTVTEVAAAGPQRELIIRIRFDRGLPTVKGSALPLSQRSLATGHVTLRHGTVSDAVFGRFLASAGLR